MPLPAMTSRMSTKGNTWAINHSIPDKKSRTHFFCRSISVLRPSVEMPEAIVQRDGDNAQCVRNTVQFFYQLSVATVQCDGTVSIADTQLLVDEGG